MTDRLTKEFIKAEARDILQVQGEAEAAEYIAKKVFDGMTDRQGEPYYDHLKFVAGYRDTLPLEIQSQLADDPRNRAVGWLHDLLEKFGRKPDQNGEQWTMGDLKFIGFSDYTVQGVDAFTRRPGEKYFDHMVRLGRTPQFIPIKRYGDLKHNRDPARAEKAREDYDDRMEKYRVSDLYLASVYKFARPDFNFSQEGLDPVPVPPGTPFVNWMMVQKFDSKNVQLLYNHSNHWIPYPSMDAAVAMLVPRSLG